jgi:hypothetical protein
LGNLPDHKGFPVTSDLTTAVSYVEVEEEINRQLGHTRSSPTPAPAEEILFADPKALPSIKATSALAQGLQTRLYKARIELRDMVRWLTFFVLGAVGLSLGIAYMLTHLYREQPFPAFVYYITLQFIDRPLRGALFMVLGVGVILIAIRSFYQSASLDFWRKWRL